MNLREKLAEAWEKQKPCCLSCGWCPVFHEIGEDDLQPTGDRSGEYHANCVSEDAYDTRDHRGYYVYLEASEKEMNG